MTAKANTNFRYFVLIIIFFLVCLMLTLTMQILNRDPNWSTRGIKEAINLHVYQSP